MRTWEARRAPETRKSPERTYCGRHNRVVIGTRAISDPRPHTVADNGRRECKARRSDGEGEKDRPSREIGCHSRRHGEQEGRMRVLSTTAPGQISGCASDMVA